ncbi:MAG: DUF4129 domain-containing protein [Thermoplasmata archaeon]|nr:DUF4129 domain-containing protein [Thermoplasmata archaeon]
MAARMRSLPPSAALGIFLLGAVAFGVAASFLAGASQPFEAQATAAMPVGYAYLEVASAIVLFGIIARVVYGFVQAVHRGTLPIPGHTMALLLTMFGIALVFLLLFHLVGGGGTAAQGNLTAPNHTQPPPPPTGGSTSASGNFTGAGGVNLPGWVVYLGLGVTSILVVAVALPYLIAARREPPFPLPRTGPTPEEVRAAIRRALDDLDSPAPMSGNRRIIAAYAALLERFEERRPRGVDGAIETMTPRDIERVCVERLRVSPLTARELTDLFEEARYSKHQLTETDVERARRALRKALDDLERTPRLG